MTASQRCLVVGTALLAATLWVRYVSLPAGPLTTIEGRHLVLSQALAAGAGYPHDRAARAWGAVPTPPLVPLLLAAVWRVQPDFPANATLLKLLSGFSALGVTLLLPAYLRRVGIPAAPALAATVLTAGSPIVLRQASSIVSALPFCLLMLLTFWAAERAAEPSQRLGAGVLVGTFAGLTCLTRWSGIPLMLVVAWQLARRTDRERVVGYCYGVVLSTLPWIAWLVTYGRLQSAVDPGEALANLPALGAMALRHVLELPLFAALAALPGFADIGAGAGNPTSLVLVYGLGVTTLVATVPQRFGPPVLAVLAASVLGPTAGFPMAVTPFLLAALLTAALPPPGGFGRVLAPGLVVTSLLITAALGHYRYLGERTPHQGPSPPTGVASRSAGR